MIHSTPFVIVDVETTGLEPRLDNILEIAAVKMVNGELVDEWSTMVNPGIFVPHESTAITGITTEMVKDAPRFSEVAEEYLKFIGDDGIFVAHNVEFDREFVNVSLLNSDFEKMNNPYLCTFRLAKQVHPNLSSYSLGNLADTFGVELPQAHRALFDARATALLFWKFMNVLQGGGLKRVKDIPFIQNLREEQKDLSEGQGTLF